MNVFKTHAKNLTLTSDNKIFEKPEYAKIIEVIDSLYKSGVASSFAHNCIAACDILQSALQNKGIKSKIVEVYLNVFRNDSNNNNEYLYIGYDSVRFPGEIDTHVVVITETIDPLLIDLSLGHILPSDNNKIITKCTNIENVIAQIEISNLKLNYLIKHNIKLSRLHQKNLIQRLEDENKLKLTIENTKIFIYFLMILSLINFTLNSVLVLLKLIFP